MTASKTVGGNRTKVKVNQIKSLLLLIVILTGCDLLSRNEYIETILIGSDGNEKILCEVYQTGIDNYWYEFKKVTGEGDTIEIFDSYLNDAVSGNEKFELKEKGDTIEITNSKPMSLGSKKVNGKIYRLNAKK